MLVASITVLGPGCATKKKLAKQQAEEKARTEAEAKAKKIADAKTILLSIINDQGSMTTEQKEKKLNEIKAQNFNDPEILSLIIKAQDKIAKEKDQARLEEEKRKNEMNKTTKTSQSLEDQFFAISHAASLAEADSKILETIKLFAGENVPVLIIIYQDKNNTDYDEPTTIKKYLEFLKDQKKNLNGVFNIKYDENGKITELELIKK
jgi:lipopolysaccharide export LptBFGC system permease protein LptF